MKIIDLFCGCGCFSEGFRQAGHEIVLAIDQWEPALKSHELNHPETEHWLEDISKLKTLPKADVIIGGPPCQAFSYMGLKRGEQDQRGQLIHDFIRLAKEYNYILFENVPGITQYRIYRQVLRQLKLKSRKIDCTDFGVPSIRKRMFASNFGFPQITHSQYKQYRLFSDRTTKQWVSVQDRIPIKDQFFFLRRYTGGRNGIPLRETSKPFWTLIGTVEEFYLCRRLTIDEIMIISGFPESYQLNGSVSSKFQQVANAVPPPVAKGFADLLQEDEMEVC